MKRTGTVLMAALAVGVSLPAMAGPLDRGPMQQRYNPATENMLRVPGVVGLYEQDAVASLQQAGLAVTVKRITKASAKYRGKEGQVVRQVPSAGGVAMVGSSVTVFVYMSGAGRGQETGGSMWGGGEDTGGWAPLPDQGTGSETPVGGSGFEGDLGHDVPNVPGPAQGFPKGAPAGGAGGGAVGTVGIPQGHIAPGSLGPVGKPSGTTGKAGEKVLPVTPEQQRKLHEAVENARKGKRPSLTSGGKKGKKGKEGTVVAHPVGHAVQAGGRNASPVSAEQQRKLHEAVENARKGTVGTPAPSSGKGLGASTTSPLGGKLVPVDHKPHQGKPETSQDDSGKGGSMASPKVVTPSVRVNPSAGSVQEKVQSETERKVQSEKEKTEHKTWLQRLLGR